MLKNLKATFVLFLILIASACGGNTDTPLPDPADPQDPISEPTPTQDPPPEPFALDNGLAFVASVDGISNLYVLDASDPSSLIQATSYGEDDWWVEPGDTQWSPLGDALVFGADASINDYYSANLARLDTGEVFDWAPELLDDGGGLWIHLPNWSPDGQWAAFTAIPDSQNVKLYLGNALGEFYIVSPGVEEHVESFSWSPDGSRLAFRSDRSGTTELYLYDPASQAEPVKLNGPLVENGSVSTFKWSPEGSQIAYRADAELNQKFELYLVDVNAPGVVTEVNGAMEDNFDIGADYQWSPDGSSLAYRQPLELGIPLTQIERLFVYEVASDTREFVSIVFENLDGANRSINAFLWSPNSQHLAYLADQEEEDKWDLYLVDINNLGLAPTKVSQDLGTDSDVVKSEVFSILPMSFQFSPSGDRLAFKQSEWFPGFEAYAYTHLYVFEISSGVVQVSQAFNLEDGIIGVPRRVELVAWSPNGQYIAYTHNGSYNDQFQLDLVEVSDLNNLSFTPVNSSHYAFSEDQLYSKISWSPSSEALLYILHEPASFNPPHLYWLESNTNLDLSSLVDGADRAWDATFAPVGW